MSLLFALYLNGTSLVYLNLFISTFLIYRLMSAKPKRPYETIVKYPILSQGTEILMLIYHVCSFKWYLILILLYPYNAVV